jgi:hypothetical protein
VAVSSKPKPGERSVENNSPHQIYSDPALASSYSDTLQYLLASIANRHLSIESNYSKEEHPLHYLYISQIEGEIEKSSLSRESKSTKNINHALSHLIDIEGGGTSKLGYVYPILTEAFDRIQINIALISPQTGKSISIKPFRENCTTFNHAILDKIFAKQIPRLTFEDEVEDLKDLLLFPDQETGILTYNPTAISFENELSLLFRDVFMPYDPLPIKDFYHDAIKYGVTSGKLIQVSHEYHILNTEFALDKTGKLTDSPEIFKHFQKILTSLHLIVIKEIQKIAQELKLMNIDALIADYKTRFTDSIENIPELEKDRILTILNIIEKFPIDNTLPDESKPLILNFKEGGKILSTIVKSITKLRMEAREKFLKNSLQSFAQRIADGSKTKKILQVVRLNKLNELEALENESLAKELEKMIVNYINSSLGFIDESQEGNRVYQVVDPMYFSSVLNHHCELKNTGATGAKQYKYCKLIEEHLQSGILSAKLDEGIPPKELTKIQKSIADFNEKLRQEKLLEEKRANFNSRVAYLSGIFIFLFLFSVYQISKSIIIGLLTIPISVGAGYALGKYYRKNKGQSSIEEEDPSEKWKPRRQNGSMDPYYKSVESILFPTSYSSIKDRIYTHKRLRKVLTDNIKSIKLKASKLYLNQSDDKIIINIENGVFEECKILKIPADKIPKNEPKLYIFSKKDISTPLVKNKITEYFKKLSEKINPPDLKIQKYYLFVIESLNKLK